ncbi:MAG TPA: tetratricopeptide repeat protein, partial [Hyphomicrobiaceae bacterium]|nr:tetratricopeptide repeat protein [Hyphomicrobiaceae bacterium]
VRLAPHSIEAPIALATAALEAKSFDEARRVLEALSGERQTQRVCSLMARIEAEDGENRGKAREWLGRAANAPRDPAWTADGVVSDRWAPISPATGRLDAFEWRVPSTS